MTVIFVSTWYVFVAFCFFTASSFLSGSAGIIFSVNMEGRRGGRVEKKLYNVHVSEIRFINNIDFR